MKSVLDFAEGLYLSYERYVETTLGTRRFKHRDMLPLIRRIEKNPLFDIGLAGYSTERREIYLLKTGLGKIKVFLWSQMHGDEPTATAALFDIFNFLSQTDAFSVEIKCILDKLELCFLPMVNPDGVQQYKRRNILDIDLNRDAARLEAEETQLLKKIRDQIEPQYGFNLHDQDTYYTAGASKFPATISFLAPSFNPEKEINETRLKSIEQIVLMNKVLQNYIPNCIGRYSDDFMPNAFGDNMQRWGTGTILIESGGYYNDPEKQVARKMNFISVLSSLYAIATGKPDSVDLRDYDNIPENKKEKLFDLLVRNALIEKEGKSYKIDVGIRNKEMNSADFTSFETVALVADIGDLSNFYGYREIDANGLYIRDLNLKRFDRFLVESRADFCLLQGNNELIYKIENGRIID